MSMPYPSPSPSPTPKLSGPRTEDRGSNLLSERISGARKTSSLFAQAALAAEVDVPILEGAVRGDAQGHFLEDEASERRALAAGSLAEPGMETRVSITAPPRRVSSLRGGAARAVA
jgi:hypothetical protein